MAPAATDRSACGPWGPPGPCGPRGPGASGGAGALLELEEPPLLDDESLLDDWAVAMLGPKNAVPMAPPVSNEPVTIAAAMPLCMTTPFCWAPNQEGHRTSCARDLSAPWESP